MKKETYKRLNNDNTLDCFIVLNEDGAIWGDNDRRSGEPIMPAIFYTTLGAEILGGKTDNRAIRKCKIIVENL